MGKRLLEYDIGLEYLLFSTAILFIQLVFLLVFPVNHAIPAKTKWPAKCKGKSYCHIKPDNYPSEIIEKLAMGAEINWEQYNGMTNRTGIVTDVAGCIPRKLFLPFYLIKDENDDVRFVAQTKEFSFVVQVEECRKPGRKLASTYLDRVLLKEDRVDCFETRLPILFPVLSLDGMALESAAPKGGISLSCSAKLMSVR